MGSRWTGGGLKTVRPLPPHKAAITNRCEHPGAGKQLLAPDKSVPGVARFKLLDLFSSVFG